jgi:aminopeptidase N
MRQHLLFFFIFSSLSSVFSQNAPCIDFQCDLVEAEMKGHMDLVKPHTTGFANDYNLIYQRCNWNLDPAVNFISGGITSYFKPSISSFSQVNFDMNDSLHTDSVVYHQHSIAYTHGTGNLLRISLPLPLPAACIDSLTVYYHGVPQSSGFGSFYQGTHQGAPVIWTLSEPYGAKDWWPCKQNLVDKIDSLDILVTTPQAYKVAGNGVLVSETISGTNKICHWKTRYPIATYLVAVAVTNYVQYSHYFHPASSTDSMEVLNYVYPEHLQWAQSVTPVILNTLFLYDSLTINYPFKKEKYGHAEFGWGGGMEHQTMSFIGGYSNVLLSHECAHQWFGDRLTLGSWADIWLNEGFATYFEALTEERYYPENWLRWKKNTISSAIMAPNGSVQVDDTTSVSRIFSGSLSYSKGSYLLHMLRWKLGDATFFQGLRSYLNDTALAYRYVRTTDLKRHLEAVSGQNLSSFFNEWFYNRGFPSYQLTWSQDGPQIQLTLNQTQSDASVTFFEMPVPVEFSGEGRDTTIILDHQYSGQTFNFRLPFTAEYAYLDPQLHILSANNRVSFIPSGATMTASLTLYPNPATEEVRIVNLNPANPIQEVRLFGLPGNLVRVMETGGNPDNWLTLNLTGIAPGMYQLSILTKLGTAVKKLEIK